MLLWWAEDIHDSCSSRNTSLNVPWSPGNLCNHHPWRTTTSNASRGGGTTLKAPPEILPSPGFKAKPLPFHRPSGMSALPAVLGRNVLRELPAEMCISSSGGWPSRPETPHKVPFRLFGVSIRTCLRKPAISSWASRRAVPLLQKTLNFPFIA